MPLDRNSMDDPSLKPVNPSEFDKILSMCEFFGSFYEIPVNYVWAEFADPETATADQVWQTLSTYLPSLPKPDYKVS